MLLNTLVLKEDLGQLQDPQTPFLAVAVFLQTISHCLARYERLIALRCEDFQYITKFRTVFEAGVARSCIRKPFDFFALPTCSDGFYRYWCQWNSFSKVSWLSTGFLPTSKDILWIPSGWFHTVRSSRQSVALSIFHRGLTPVAELLVSLMNPRHLRKSHGDSEGIDVVQEALIEELEARYPDLRSEEVEEDGEKENDREVASAFNSHLHSRRSGILPAPAHVRGQKLLEALREKPLLTHLASALERKLDRSSELDFPQQNSPALYISQVFGGPGG